MSKVMIVTYGGGHVNVLLPIVKRLRERGDEVSVLGLTVAGDVLRRHNIPFKTYTDYFDDKLDADALAVGRELAKGVFVEGKGMSLRDTEIYLGIGMRDLILQHGEERAKELYEKHGRKMFLQVHTMGRIIDEEKPDMVITTNVPRSERAANIAANQRDIPTLNISDYFEFEERFPLEGKRIAVMCDITKQNLIKRGVAPERIVITGQPAFDDISRQAREIRREDVFKKYGLDPSVKWLVLGTQPIETTPDIVRNVLKAAMELEGVNVVLKPHPGEDAKLHEEIIAELGSPAKLRNDADIRELIVAGECLITFFSTIGFEAVLMGKPLITVNFTGKPNPVPLWKFGVADEVTKEEDVAKALNRALFDDEYKEQLAKIREEKFGAIVDGHGTDRVMDLIDEMLAE